MPRTPGELNFLISKLLDEYLGASPHYAEFNEAIAALGCAELELHRRLELYRRERQEANENQKLVENGEGGQ